MRWRKIYNAHSGSPPSSFASTQASFELGPIAVSQSVRSALLGGAGGVSERARARLGAGPGLGQRLGTGIFPESF